MLRILDFIVVGGGILIAAFLIVYMLLDMFKPKRDDF